MEIEFPSTRLDQIKIFFLGLRYSGRTRLIISGMVALIFAYALYLRYRGLGSVQLYDVLYSLLLGLSLLLVIPLLLVLAYKPQKRRVSLQRDGILHQIGERKEKMPWSGVHAVISGKHDLIVAGNSGSIFLVPKSGFTSQEQCERFVRQARRMKASGQ